MRSMVSTSSLIERSLTVRASTDFSSFSLSRSSAYDDNPGGGGGGAGAGRAGEWCVWCVLLSWRRTIVLVWFQRTDCSPVMIILAPTFLVPISPTDHNNSSKTLFETVVCFVDLRQSTANVADFVFVIAFEFSNVSLTDIVFAALKQRKQVNERRADKTDFGFLTSFDQCT
jgi:hypothetical protein